MRISKHAVAVLGAQILLVAATAAQAESPPVFEDRTVGPWQVDASDTNTHCSAKTTFDNGVELWLALKTTGDGWISVGNESWKSLEARKDDLIPVVFRFGNQAVESQASVIGSAHMLVAGLTQAESLRAFNAWADSSQVEIVAEGKRLGAFRFADARPAAEALLDCALALQAADPFAK